MFNVPALIIFIIMLAIWKLILAVLSVGAILYVLLHLMPRYAYNRVRIYDFNPTKVRQIAMFNFLCALAGGLLLMYPGTLWLFASDNLLTLSLSVENQTGLFELNILYAFSGLLIIAGIANSIKFMKIAHNLELV